MLVCTVTLRLFVPSPKGRSCRWNVLLWSSQEPWLLSQWGFTCGVLPTHTSSTLPPCALPSVLASQRWCARRSSVSFESFHGSEVQTGSSSLGAHSLRFWSFPYPRHCSWKVSCGVILRKYKEKESFFAFWFRVMRLLGLILTVAYTKDLQLSVSTVCFIKPKAEKQVKSLTIKYQSCCKWATHFPSQGYAPHLSPPGVGHLSAPMNKFSTISICQSLYTLLFQQLCLWLLLESTFFWLQIFPEFCW